MDKSRYIYLGITLFLLTIMLMEPAFCQINNQQIQAASQSFVATLNDWSVPVIAGGLFGSGVCLFTSNYRMGLAGLAGTGFLYAVREFTNAGGAVLISMAEQLIN